MNFWDAVAPVYRFAVSKDRAAYGQLVRLNRMFLSPSMRVLELGCGPGNVTEHIASATKEIVATDFSEKMIERAKATVKLDNVTFEVADAKNLPYPDASFDAVVTSNMLHVIDDPEAVLAQARRVLKPGGTLIASSFVKGTKRAEVIRLGLNVIGKGTFHTWDFKQFVEFFRENGWQIHSARKIKSLFPLAAVIATRPKDGEE